jgi:hypothetical protein
VMFKDRTVSGIAQNVDTTQYWDSEQTSPKQGRFSEGRK